MDLSVNKPLIDHKFTMWYSSQVEKPLQKGESVENLKLNLRMSEVKLLSVNWIVSAADYLKEPQHNYQWIHKSWNHASVAS